MAEDIPILRRIGEYRAQIWSRKWWILGLSVLLMAFFGYRELKKPTQFIATAKFHPENEGSSSVNLDNPASLLFGGGLVPEESQNMIGILKSRRIFEAVLRDTIVVHIDTFFVYRQAHPYGIYQKGGRRDSISLIEAEKILLVDKVEAIFRGEPSLLQRFLAWLLPEEQQRSFASRLYRAGRQLDDRMSATIGDEGFIDFSLSVPNKVYAKILADKYIIALRAYYQNQKTEKAKRNLDFFTYRADSVKTELDAVNRRVANFLDRSRYRVMASEEVLPRELQVTSELLQQLYISLMLSKEQAASQLQEDKPILQVLDVPRPPFKVEKGSLLKGIILGLFLGVGFLSFWFCRKLIREDLMGLLRRSLTPPPPDSAY
ncbi:MAG: hypothetical protein AAFQ68_15255 [Bacteroidota bacterium]